MSYLQKMCVPEERKGINIKAFNTITNKNEAKATAEHISCDCKCKFNTVCNLNQKWNNKKCHCECENYRKCKKDYNWNPSTCICESNKYLKSVGNTSLTKFDEIVIVMGNLSTKKTITIATNVTSTASINYHDKKVRDSYILHRVLLTIILLFKVTIICYHYAKQKGIT